MLTKPTTTKTMAVAVATMGILSRKKNIAWRLRSDVKTTDDGVPSEEGLQRLNDCEAVASLYVNARGPLSSFPGESRSLSPSSSTKQRERAERNKCWSSSSSLVPVWWLFPPLFLLLLRGVMAMGGLRHFQGSVCVRQWNGNGFWWWW